MFGGKEQIIAESKRAERERAGGESGAPALPFATSNATLAKNDGRSAVAYAGERAAAPP
jgi:hypothetical protein